MTIFNVIKVLIATLIEYTRLSLRITGRPLSILMWRISSYIILIRSFQVLVIVFVVYILLALFANGEYYN